MRTFIGDDGTRQVKNGTDTDPDLMPQVSRREFTHKGLAVTEVVFDLNDGRHKVVWCLTPFEHMVVDGRENPCCHVDYKVEDDVKVGDDEVVDACRRRCREAFEHHHDLTSVSQPLA